MTAAEVLVVNAPLPYRPSMRYNVTTMGKAKGIVRGTLVTLIASIWITVLQYTIPNNKLPMLSKATVAT